MLTTASPPTIRLPSTKCFVVKPARFYLEFVWAHSGGNGCFINRPGLHSPERCEILQTLCSSRKPAGTKQHFLDCNISLFRRDCFGRVQNEFKQYLFPAELPCEARDTTEQTQTHPFCRLRLAFRAADMFVFCLNGISERRMERGLLALISLGFLCQYLIK